MMLVGIGSHETNQLTIDIVVVSRCINHRDLQLATLAAHHSKYLEILLKPESNFQKIFERFEFLKFQQSSNRVLLG